MRGVGECIVVVTSFDVRTLAMKKNLNAIFAVSVFSLIGNNFDVHAESDFQAEDEASVIERISNFTNEVFGGSNDEKLQSSAQEVTIALEDLILAIEEIEDSVIDLKSGKACSASSSNIYQRLGQEYQHFGILFDEGGNLDKAISNMIEFSRNKLLFFSDPNASKSFTAEDLQMFQSAWQAKEKNFIGLRTEVRSLSKQFSKLDDASNGYSVKAIQLCDLEMANKIESDISLLIKNTREVLPRVETVLKSVAA